MSTQKRFAPLDMTEAASAAIHHFAFLTYLQDDPNDPDIFEVLEDFLIALREWSISEGDVWDDDMFLRVVHDVVRRAEATDASRCDLGIAQRQCLLDKGHEGMHEIAAGGNWNTAFHTFHRGDGHKPFPLPIEVRDDD